MEQLTTNLIQNDDVWTLKLSGSIGPKTHEKMWYVDSSASLLKNMLETNVKKLVLDLTETERFDSLGLRRLLNAQKEFSNESISIVIRNPNAHLNRLFQIMQFDRIFEIEYVD